MMFNKWYIGMGYSEIDLWLFMLNYFITEMTLQIHFNGFSLLLLIICEDEILHNIISKSNMEKWRLNVKLITIVRRIQLTDKPRHQKVFLDYNDKKEWEHDGISLKNGQWGE